MDITAHTVTPAIRELREEDCEPTWASSEKNFKKPRAGMWLSSGVPVYGHGLILSTEKKKASVHSTISYLFIH